jgi:hypothetical protein
MGHIFLVLCVTMLVVVRLDYGQILYHNAILAKEIRFDIIGGVARDECFWWM